VQTLIVQPAGNLSSAQSATTRSCLTQTQFTIKFACCSSWALFESFFCCWDGDCPRKSQITLLVGCQKRRRAAVSLRKTKTSSKARKRVRIHPAFNSLRAAALSKPEALHHCSVLRITFSRICAERARAARFSAAAADQSLERKRTDTRRICVDNPPPSTASQKHISPCRHLISIK